MLRTEIKILDPRLVGKLGYATEHSAGLDLRACYTKEVGSGAVQPLNDQQKTYTLYPGATVLVGSGIAIYLASTQYTGAGDTEYYVDACNSLAAVLLPRSGLGTKLNIRLANTVGLIDADYQGEILMAVQNGGTDPFVIGALDRLVQMVIVPVVRPSFTQVDVFSADTVRGSGGFGSTGKD